MQEGSLPKDIFTHDVKTFPTKDSALAAKQAQQRKKQEEAEQREKKQRGRPPKQPASTKPPSAAEKKAEAASARKGTLAQKSQKVHLYFHYLAHKLPFAEPDPFPTTHNGLDEVLDKIECHLHGEGGIQKATALYTGAAFGLEKILEHVNPLGLDLSGPEVSFAQAVAANKEKWLDLVREFAIENASWFMFGPTKRLVFTTFQLVMAVDAANKRAGMRTPASRDMPVPENVAKSAEGL